MATITINIPTDKVTWVLDGMALRYGYQTDIENPAFDHDLPEDPDTNPTTIPNPESKGAFAKRFVIMHIKSEATQGYISQEWTTRKAEENDVTLT